MSKCRGAFSHYAPPPTPLGGVHPPACPLDDDRHCTSPARTGHMYSNGALVMLTESKYMRRCKVIGGIARSNRVWIGLALLRIAQCNTTPQVFTKWLTSHRNILRASIKDIPAIITLSEYSFAITGLWLDAYMGLGRPLVRFAVWPVLGATTIEITHHGRIRLLFTSFVFHWVDYCCRGVSFAV